MTQPTSPTAPVTPLQWLAVATIWGAAVYGTMAGKPAMHQPMETTARLIVCR